MSKKILAIVVCILAVSLTGCSLHNPFRARPAANSTKAGSKGFGNALENKLAIGTLRLEGTDKAITAAQAKQLLPLWQQVRSQSQAATPDANAVLATYKQIENGMTLDQVQAIKDMNVSQNDIEVLAKTYGVPFTPAPTLSAAEQATRQAQNKGGAGAGRSLRATNILFSDAVIQLLQTRSAG